MPGIGGLDSRRPEQGASPVPSHAACRSPVLKVAPETPSQIRTLPAPGTRPRGCAEVSLPRRQGSGDNLYPRAAVAGIRGQQRGSGLSGHRAGRSGGHKPDWFADAQRQSSYRKSCGYTWVCGCGYTPSLEVRGNMRGSAGDASFRFPYRLISRL